MQKCPICKSKPVQSENAPFLWRCSNPDCELGEGYYLDEVWEKLVLDDDDKEKQK